MSESPQRHAPAHGITTQSQEQAAALTAALQKIASNLAKAGVSLGAMPSASADKIAKTEQAAARSGNAIG